MTTQSIHVPVRAGGPRLPLRLLEDSFRRPQGWSGRLVGHAMARQHLTLTRWTLGLLEVAPTERVLDVGCGGGMAVRLLAARASRGHVAAVDYSPEMVAQARRRNAAAVAAGRVDVRLGDAAALPWPDAAFDAACAIETLYFWADPVAGLRELHRVLRPGGRVAVTLEMSREAGGRTLRQRLVGTRFARRSAAQGLAVLSGPELADLLRRAGFHDVRYAREADRSFGWLCAQGRR